LLPVEGLNKIIPWGVEPESAEWSEVSSNTAIELKVQSAVQA